MMLRSAFIGVLLCGLATQASAAVDAFLKLDDVKNSIVAHDAADCTAKKGNVVTVAGGRKACVLPSSSSAASGLTIRKSGNTTTY